MTRNTGIVFDCSRFSSLAFQAEDQTCPTPVDPHGAPLTPKSFAGLADILCIAQDEWLQRILNEQRTERTALGCWIRRPGMSQLKHRPCINIGPLRATNDRVKPEYRSVVPPTFYEINRLLKSTPIGPRKAGRCRGRDQQKSSSSSLTIGLHIIAARVRFGEEFGQRRLKGYESSHLCHNRECFNPQHVYLESKRANLARDACRDREEVTVDGKKVLTCEHGDVDSEIPFCTLRRLIIETVPYKTITGGVAAYQREQAKQMIRRARKDCNFYVEV